MPENLAERYASLDEFMQDLQHPNPEFLKDSQVNKTEGNTVFFWKILSFLWLAILLVVLVLIYQD